MTALAKALVAAQAEMPAVKPDATNPHFKSAFVSLDHLLAQVRPVLNRHGLAVAQFPTVNEAGLPTLTTILMHESGESLEYVAPLYLSNPTAQGHGSAITYGRRYALASALGISAEEDKDGEPIVDESDLKSAGTVTFPGGPHKGETVEEAYRKNPGYIAQVAQHAGDETIKRAAQAVLADARRAGNSTTEF